MKCFINYNIDYVIKFGGSIITNKKATKKLLSNLVKLSKKGKRILIIPGGGPTDNTIEDLHDKYNFHINLTHITCALAQDQTGIMLSKYKNIEYCDNFEAMLEIQDKNKVAVLLPSKLLFNLHPVEKTWNITSDAIACYFYWLLNAKKFIILTNVDGIFKKFNTSKEKFVKYINTKDLLKLGHTSVDKCTIKFLKTKKLDCLVINGLKPKRILNIEKPSKITHTLIIGK